MESSAVIDSLLDPGAFFVPQPGAVRIERSPDRWRAWLTRPDYPSDRPLIEVRRTQRFEVIRNVPMRGGEWLSELVGTAPFDQPDALRRCIGFALTGTSRLAITSIETPHPAFALGMLAYLPPGGEPVAELEARLRSSTPTDLPIDRLPGLLPDLFNRLALSPYTALADNLIALILKSDRDHAVDMLGYMLRHLARHLNAFDLVKFHNRGANYPDALFLDALLRAYVPLLRPEDGKMRRRALQEGWLARKRCQGLRVPDHPTSPGDNARDLPYPPLPPAQLSEPSARTKRLFLDQPAEALLNATARELLVASIADLADPDELRELGTATFLDRPLGVAKREGEADRTPLLSYEACSVRLIKTRLKELRDAGLLTDDRLSRLNPAAASGFPVARLPGHARHGIVSLEDAKKVALDFVFTRTTRSSIATLLSQYDFSALNAAAPVLLIRTGRGGLTAFAAGMSPLFELELAEPPHYVECGGVEYAEGLCAVVSGRRLSLPPRLGR